MRIINFSNPCKKKKKSYQTSDPACRRTLDRYDDTFAVLFDCKIIHLPKHRS